MFACGRKKVRKAGNADILCENMETEEGHETEGEA